MTIDSNEKEYLRMIPDYMEDEEIKKKIFKTIEVICWWYEIKTTRPGCGMEYVLEQFEEDEVVALVRRAWAIYEHEIWCFENSSPRESRNKFIEYCIETEPDKLIQYEYYLVEKLLVEMEENWAPYYTLYFGDGESLRGFPLFVGTFFPYKYKREVEKFVEETLEKISFEEVKKMEEEFQELDQRMSDHMVYRNKQVEAAKQYYEKYHIKNDNILIPIIDKYVVNETDRNVQRIISELSEFDVCLMTMVLSSEADYKIFRNVTNRYNHTINEDVVYKYEQYLDDPRETELEIEELIEKVSKIIRA